jgi:branched-subunit amino acid ABC-type transport system permease component
VKIVEEPLPAVNSKLPWFIDVFLYPASLHGIVYLAIFLIAPVLIGLLERFVLSHVRYYGRALSLILHVLLIGYILYYFAYCVFDSSRGGPRAPNVSSEHIPDKADLLSQILLILGCIAICFLPIAAYYIFTNRIDRFFWLSAAVGFFLFPMALLAGVLFDSFDALNPIMIIRSILRTFLAYCGLILSRRPSRFICYS